MKNIEKNNTDLSLNRYKTEGVVLKRFILLPTTSSSGYAIRKDHTDTTFTSLNATSLTSGVLPASTIAGKISGDFEGLTTTTVKIKNRITQGTFTGVGVNSKGLVTSSFSLQATNIPNLDFSKFTIKPTTAGGYGITDVLLNTGGTINGNIKLSAAPSQDSHATTKKYVDDAVLASSNLYLKPGDIISKSSGSSYAGFLRCNGAIISKTTYSKLYAAIGEGSSYDANNFKIPDLTSLDRNGYTHFIKT